MKEFFTVGEIAKMFNIKIATLRYYDQIGLLKPQYTDEKTNYRYYATPQFERLNSIKYLRALGMPLQKISDFFNYRSIDGLTSMLEQQHTEVARKQLELVQIEQKITRRLAQIKDASQAVLDQVEEIELPKLRLIYLQHEYAVGQDIEYLVSELIQNYGVDRGIFLGKIGLLVSVKNLVAKQYTKYTGLFMLLEDEDQPSMMEKIIPARKYLQIYFRGSHSDALLAYKKLADYMAGKHYHIAGDSMEIALIDYGMTNDIEKYVTKILLPYDL